MAAAFSPLCANEHTYSHATRRARRFSDEWFRLLANEVPGGCCGRTGSWDGLSPSRYAIPLFKTITCSLTLGIGIGPVSKNSYIFLLHNKREAHIFIRLLLRRSASSSSIRCSGATVPLERRRMKAKGWKPSGNKLGQMAIMKGEGEGDWEMSEKDKNGIKKEFLWWQFLK